MKPIPLKAGDIIAVIFVALCAALSFALTGSNSGGQSVEIISGGEAKLYALGENRAVTLESEGVTLTVEIKDGAVSVTESDCPDRECVHSPAISKAGGVIVCVPAKTLIKIIGARDADFIAG